jgi:uncharacterized metal-binding protein YceD (DUF177 family)
MNSEPFSFSVVANDIPAEGRRYRLQADAEELRRLAESLDIPEVGTLTADLDVRPVAGQSVVIRGTLNASVVQTDVVTLEPVHQQVAEEVDLTLVKADATWPGLKPGELVDATEPDGPDLYHNGRIDLGVIVAEHLALGLDPYPRAPGVDFPGYVEDDPTADPSPFAALAKLAQRD